MYKFSLPALFVALLVFNTTAPASELVAPALVLAQTETGADRTIFDELKIELDDLKKMSEIFSERLQGEAVRMTLDESVQAALAANRDILIVSYEPLKSAADLQGARGEFDPVLSLNMNYSDASQPASPQTLVFGGITSVDQRLTESSLNLGGKLRWGTQYNVEVFNVREQGTFVFDPVAMRTDISEYNSGATVSLTQPLLRGFGTKSNLARVRTALNNQTANESQVKLTVLTSVGDVVKAYWDLVGAIETLRVRQESLANAERLVEINEQRLRIGTAAAIEVLQAKAGAASRYSDLVSAQTAIADAEDVLKNLIGMDDGELFSTKSIVPTDRPRVSKIDWDLDRSTAAALANRPDIHTAEIALDNAKIELARAKRDRHPSLDLSTSYGQSGRAFDAAESFRDTGSQEGYRATVGATASIPILNRSARGAHRRAQLEIRQSERRLEKAKRDVLLGVRIALRAVATNEILVESTGQARILQQANVAAEEKRLHLGVTTSQDLLDIQEDLTAAQTQEVQAMISLEKSVIDLQVSEGTLLENLGIEFSPPEADDLP